MDPRVCEETEGEASAGYAGRRSGGSRLSVGPILFFNGHHVGNMECRGRRSRLVFYAMIHWGYFLLVVLGAPTSLLSFKLPFFLTFIREKSNKGYRSIPESFLLRFCYEKSNSNSRL